MSAARINHYNRATFARVAEITSPGVSPDRGVAFFRDRVLPDLRQYEGFEDAIVLVPREGEEVLVISLVRLVRGIGIRVD